MSNPSPSNDDLRVFTSVVLKSSFAAAAQDLGASPAYVSKRVRVLEEQLGTRLLHRTTRRVALTEDGERAYRWAQRILDDVDQLLQEVGGTRAQPRGTLRVSSSFGFGRRQVAPALSALLRSMWQVAPLLAEGKLVQVLPGCLQPANVWAVYPVRLERSAKLRVAVEFLVQWFQTQAPRGGVRAQRKSKRL